MEVLIILFFAVQLDSGHFQEQTQEYTRWKELRDRLAADLRLSFNNLKLQTSNLANHHLDVIKQLKELQFRILDQELNRWKRDQQLSGICLTFCIRLKIIGVSPNANFAISLNITFLTKRKLFYSSDILHNFSISSV